VGRPKKRWPDSFTSRNRLLAYQPNRKKRKKERKKETNKQREKETNKQRERERERERKCKNLYLL
jgi:hypothetical protein